MEMEKTLSPEAGQPGPDSPPPGRTDGLAAALAVEHDAQTGAPDSPERPPDLGKRRGRPPIHGLYSRAAGSDGHRPAALGGPDQVGPVEMENPGEKRVSIPPDLLTQLVGQTLCLGEDLATYKIQAMAARAGLTPGEIAPQLARAQLGDQRKQLVADLTPYALQEWGLDPQISPTAAIGLILAPWTFGAVSAYWTLAGLAAEKLSREKARDKSGDKSADKSGDNAEYGHYPEEKA